MARPAARRYLFTAAGHWRSGAASGLAWDGQGLAVTAPLVGRRIEEAGAGAGAGVDACGRPAWLRTESGELVVLHDFGAETRGHLDGAGSPDFLFAGARRIWVREGNRLRRYDGASLQRLGELTVPGLRGACSDGGDGLWLLVQRRIGAYVRHIDGWGCLARRRIELRQARTVKGIAAAPDGGRLAVLDGPSPGCGTTGADWQLHFVDVPACRAEAPLPCRSGRDEPSPDLIAWDRQGRLAIASREQGAPLLLLDSEGNETGRQALRIAGPLRALAGGDGLVVAAADGLYRLRPAGAGDEDAGVAVATLITPALVSPPGTPGGWNRADIEVVLPLGASLRVSVAASGQSLPVGAEEGPGRLAAADSALAWRTQRSRTFPGTGGRQRLRLLLDGLPESHLWLKLEFTVPALAGAASLLGLSVRYPDLSFLDELPAIYRDQPGPASQLRQFLAPFEALFDDIDDEIDALPERIDPATASPEWLPYLLTWLGFPPTIGLGEKVQRALLAAAPGLIERRGTLAALRDMLEIVTGAPAEVTDSAEQAAFWIVGKAGGRLAPRLGRDTRIVAGYPAEFTLGRGARLRASALGPPCTDVGHVLDGQCALVRIRIVVDPDPDRRAILRPIIRSLLASFVPAHCRIDLRFEDTERPGTGSRLDEDGLDDGTGGRVLTLPGAGTALGLTRAGCWELPPGEPGLFTIDGTAALDGARRLV